jgi:hypothetical protein
MGSTSRRTSDVQWLRFAKAERHKSDTKVKIRFQHGILHSGKLETWRCWMFWVRLSRLTRFSAQTVWNSWEGHILFMLNVILHVLSLFEGRKYSSPTPCISHFLFHSLTIQPHHQNSLVSLTYDWGWNLNAIRTHQNVKQPCSTRFPCNSSVNTFFWGFRTPFINLFFKVTTKPFGSKFTNRELWKFPPFDLILCSAGVQWGVQGRIHGPATGSGFQFPTMILCFFWHYQNKKVIHKLRMVDTLFLMIHWKNDGVYIWWFGSTYLVAFYMDMTRIYSNNPIDYSQYIWGIVPLNE